MTGRGAWPVSGLGGTKQYKDANSPGPYYFIGSGYPNAGVRDANEYAVWKAVLAYQRALNRRIKAGLTLDGLFGPQTSAAVTEFQKQTGNTVWGGIGPETSRALLIDDLANVVEANDNIRLPQDVVSGTIHHESNWDAGAVGYVDDRDLGLAQINSASHPDLSDAERLQPLVAFQFVCDYYNNALTQLKNNLRDSIASYNLGIGGFSKQYNRLVGAKGWIADGRPDVWTPVGSDTPRNVKDYIDSILAG